MKRSELIKRIRQEAGRQGVAWKAVEGAKHDTFWFGSVKIPIPRHTPRLGSGPPRTSSTNAKPN
jgi:hypothetical protein